MMIARNRIQPRTHQSRSFTERRHRRVWIGAVAGVVAVSSWLFAMHRLSYLPVFAIESVQVYGTDAELGRSLQAAAFEALDGSYLGIFSRSNTVMYPRRGVAAAIAAVSPQIETVRVKRDGSRAITITVTEKAPAAVVCADLPDFAAAADAEDGASLGDNCYVADRTGKLISRAAADAEIGTATHYYAPTLPSDPIGMYATSTDEFTALEAFVRSVRSTGIVPKALLIKDDYEYELFTENPADPAGLTIIYFSSAEDLQRQLSNLSAFWNRMTSEASAKGRKADFEHIDVRYGANVFYRTNSESDI